MKVINLNEYRVKRQKSENVQWYRQLIKDIDFVWDCLVTYDLDEVSLALANEQFLQQYKEKKNGK